MNARVERLIAWSDDRLVLARKILSVVRTRCGSGHRRPLRRTYSQLLVHMHTATEWLVR